MLDKIKGWLTRSKLSKADQNIALHKKLKKQWDSDKFTTGGQSIDLMQIYVSRAENVYYCHKDIMQIHVVRQRELTLALQRVAFNIDDRELDKWIKGMRDKINTEQTYQMHAHLNDLEIRRKKIPQAEVFISCALPLILRHDENPYTYQKNIRDAKMREIASDPDLRSFFLSEGYAEGARSLKAENLKDWKMQSLQDFLDHWTQEQMDRAAQQQTPTG